MNIFSELIFKIKKHQAGKKTDVLCQRMLELYNYYFATHPTDLSVSDFIKEAVPFMPGWKPVTRDVFEYGKGGVFEVRQDDTLPEAVKKMAKIEIDCLAKKFPAISPGELEETALSEVSEFFRVNRPR